MNRLLCLLLGHESVRARIYADGVSEQQQGWLFERYRERFHAWDPSDICRRCGKDLRP